MKRKMIAALAFTMLLCGCGETSDEQKADTVSENTTTAVTTSAESTTTETASAETVTTTASAANTEDENAAATTVTAAYEDTSVTVIESLTDAVYNDLFAGYYLDENSSAALSIDCTNDKLYKIIVSRKISETETEEWYFTGEFNGRQVLSYDSCIKSLMTVAEDGSVSSEQEYSDGTGYVRISEEGTKTGLVWSDDKEDAGSSFLFIKQ
ncbi:hypothetical protein [Ruminococcus flavefaciens]|uniref:hypothetical protein n=1 Tax=Ruminococcus flavefaciens TaxID=1265 RepID=UPI0026F1D863|nr:hypothetical protein [Ruminococcus flavefaciens]